MASSKENHRLSNLHRMFFLMTATAFLALLLTTFARSPTGTGDATLNEATEFSLIVRSTLPK